MSNLNYFQMAPPPPSMPNGKLTNGLPKPAQQQQAPAPVQNNAIGNLLSEIKSGEFCFEVWLTNWFFFMFSTLQFCFAGVSLRKVEPQQQPRIVNHQSDLMREIRDGEKILLRTLQVLSTDPIYCSFQASNSAKSNNSAMIFVRRINQISTMSHRFSHVVSLSSWPTRRATVRVKMRNGANKQTRHQLDQVRKLKSQRAMERRNSFRCFAAAVGTWMLTMTCSCWVRRTMWSCKMLMLLTRKRMHQAKKKVKFHLSQ